LEHLTIFGLHIHNRYCRSAILIALLCSLLSIIQGQTFIQDSLKIKALLNSAENNFFTGPDKALSFIDSAIILSKIKKITNLYLEAKNFKVNFLLYNYNFENNNLLIKELEKEYENIIKKDKKILSLYKEFTNAKLSAFILSGSLKQWFVKKKGKKKVKQVHLDSHI
jgi:hypothetical protein